MGSPELLLTIAVLIVVCVILYQRLRQLESTFHTRQSLVADELREAEAALMAAVQRVEGIDRRLARREERLLAHGAADVSQVAGRGDAGRGRRGDAGTGTGGTAVPVPCPRVPGTETEIQRGQAVRLARTGRTPVQIARALGLRVGEVELLLALSEHSDPGEDARRARGREEAPAPDGRGYPARSR